MKKSNTYKLAGVFVVLLLVAYLLLDSGGEWRASYALREDKLAVDSTEVVSVHITKGTDTNRIENIGGVWYVVFTLELGDRKEEKRYPADRFAVERLLSSIHNIRLRSLISSNPDRQAMFDVDALSGTAVKVVDRKGRTVEYVVGKMGPTFTETYLRPAGSNEVYLAEGVSSWEIGRSTVDWRDKTIHRIDRNAIEQIDIRLGRDEFTISRDSVWRIGNAVADSTIVTTWISSLMNVRAENFVDTALQLSSPQLEVNIRSTDNVNLRFYPILPDTVRYWVTSSETPQIFVTNKWNVQPLIKQRSEFMTPRP